MRWGTRRSEPAASRPGRVCWPALAREGGASTACSGWRVACRAASTTPPHLRPQPIAGSPPPATARCSSTQSRCCGDTRCSSPCRVRASSGPGRRRGQRDGPSGMVGELDALERRCLAAGLEVDGALSPEAARGRDPEIDGSGRRPDRGRRPLAVAARGRGELVERADRRAPGTPSTGSPSGRGAAWGVASCLPLLLEGGLRTDDRGDDGARGAAAGGAAGRARPHVGRGRRRASPPARLRRHGPGPRTSTRRRRRREAELAEGHAAFRFTGYLAVTADDETALAAACGRIEQIGRPLATRAPPPVRRPGGRLHLHPADGTGLRVKLPAARVDDGPARRRLPVRRLGAACRRARCSSARTSSAGPSRTTRSSCTRPGTVTNPNVTVLGQIGRGKSALVKTYLLRQAAFGRQVAVLDPKGEYGAACPGARLRAAASRPAVRSGSTRSTAPAVPTDLARGTGSASSCSERSRRRASADRCRLVSTPPSSWRSVRRPGLTGITPPARRSCPRSSGRSFDRWRSRPGSSERPRPASRRTAGTSASSCAGSSRATSPACSTGPRRRASTRGSGVLVLDLSAVYHSEALGALMVCAAAWLQAMTARADAQHDPRRRRGLGDPDRARRRPLPAIVVEARTLARAREHRRLPPGVRPGRERRGGQRAEPPGRGAARRLRDGRLLRPARLRAAAAGRPARVLAGGARRPAAAAQGRGALAWSAGAGTSSSTCSARTSAPSSTPTPGWPNGAGRDPDGAGRCGSGRSRRPGARPYRRPAVSRDGRGVGRGGWFLGAVVAHLGRRRSSDPGYKRPLAGGAGRHAPPCSCG